jgi:hypothetical protein
MAGYLDHYGAGDERRERRNKLFLILAAGVLLALFLWFFLFVWDKTEVLRAEPVARLAQILRNHRQENRVKNFFNLLQHRDYKAVELYGCASLQGLPFHRVHEGLGPRRSARRRGVHHSAEPFLRLGRNRNRRVRPQPGRRAVGTAQRHDDRFFAVSRMPDRGIVRARAASDALVIE